MKDYVFGANILENLTTGMYQDSKVIYREYIQNACDQIDKAVKDEILKQDEGTIKIWLDRDQRTIVIEDNATGIPAASFQQTLGNIADSDKKIGEDKGFRGIGRLCGLAYCKELIFISSAKGEDTVSLMVCDAKKMRGLIDENTRGKKHTANEVLNAINRFEQKKTNDIDSHFFRVELIDINPENTDLLDFQQVKDYLSFVAPVPYQSSFYYRTDVYKHAQELGVKIDEYNITLNGEPIFKKYTTILKDSSTGTKYDDIFGVHFQDFYKNGELFAWMWVGVSRFQKAIPKINQMRGLRLRKENIQIGGEDALQKLFKEDRGNSYFIGEVFAVNKDLIPNSQRDYFNENPARAYFELELRRYFNEELRKIYYTGSTINSSYKKIDAYEKKNTEFKEKDKAGVFVDKEHRERELKVVLESKKEAENALEKIDKIKDKADGLMQKVIQRIEVERPKPVIAVVVPPIKPPKDDEEESEKSGMFRRTDRLSQYNKAERKLISKIFSIITSVTDSKTAEMIISKIEEGLQ
ncbi:ATP-binding protein [Heliomicrobium modesticaldum]|nr:ATP-binding protein [Heliomicrobium modesticaldum]